MFSIEKPTLDKFLQAYKDGIRGRKDRLADVREGSMLEIIGGTAAIIWSREAQRDQDIFDDTTTDTASSDALSDRLYALTGVARVLDVPGVGTARVVRPTTGASGTFWEGTRILVVDRQGLVDTIPFEVAADSFVDASQVMIDLPIRAVDAGNDVANVTGSGSIVARFDDIVWDDTWTIQSLQCATGTVYEPANEYKARVKQTLLDQRLGFRTSIVAACKAAGASVVVLFAADYGGDSNDFGLNMVYVGDSSFHTPVDLIPKVMLALEKVRILGDNMQIRPVQPVTLQVEANVYLADKPLAYDLNALTTRLQNAVAGALEQDYSYSLDRFRGSMFKTSTAVQDVDFVTPLSDGDILTPFGAYLAFPATLNRYSVRPQDVILHFFGPR